jgi:hypothetical protein
MIRFCQSVMTSQGACASLMKRIVVYCADLKESGNEKVNIMDENNATIIACVETLCYALASILLFAPSHEPMQC